MVGTINNMSIKINGMQIEQVMYTTFFKLYLLMLNSYRKNHTNQVLTKISAITGIIGIAKKCSYYT